MKKVFLGALLWLLIAATALGEGVYTPSQKEAREGETANYWVTPMDITNESAVWAMLTAPITVLKGNQKKQVSLRAKPSSKADIVGGITCASQSVHVLSDDEGGWTKVECYSSSFHDSKVEKWNQLVEGYVETKLLTTVKPNQHMGLVVDKLTQRMYVFIEGKLFSTLRVSTGLPNKKQPYNETRSGEFLLVSKVGTFSDGNMVCEKAIRFNFGDLIHQVPYNRSRGDKVFDSFEKNLGSRASHGCIRVQRKRTPEGVNMSWLYKNYKKNTKIVIWEDWPGREIAPGSGSTVVYYNPKGGVNYHSAETCYSVTNQRQLPLTPITMDRLGTKEFSKLTPCVWCNPPETWE